MKNTLLFSRRASPHSFFSKRLSLKQHLVGHLPAHLSPHKLLSATAETWGGHLPPAAASPPSTAPSPPKSVVLAGGEQARSYASQRTVPARRRIGHGRNGAKRALHATSDCDQTDLIIRLYHQQVLGEQAGADEDLKEMEATPSTHGTGHAHRLAANLHAPDRSHNSSARRKTGPSFLAVSNPNVLYNSRSWRKHTYRRAEAKSNNPLIRVAGEPIEQRVFVARKAGEGIDNILSQRKIEYIGHPL